MIAVESGGAARAYPVRILVWHEIVNDRLGGRPIAVTYCPLCNSSLVFDRRVAGRELTFGTTGNLRRSNLVMWDRQTESWWQQLGGKAIVGELTGRRLRALPAQTLSWAQFKRRYPRGDVLSRDTGAERDYDRNPYLGYDEADLAPHLLEREADPRLPPKERVVALLAAEPPVVVPFSRLRSEPVVELTAGRTPAVVLYDPRVASAIDADAIGDSKQVGTAGAFRSAHGRPHPDLRTARPGLRRQRDALDLAHHGARGGRPSPRATAAPPAPRRAVLVLARGVRARGSHRRALRGLGSVLQVLRPLIGLRRRLAASSDLPLPPARAASCVLARHPPASRSSTTRLTGRTTRGRLSRARAA